MSSRRMTFIAFSASGLSSDDRVGDERQGARAFDRHRHLPLVLGTVPGNAPGDDLPPLGHEVLERGLVLEVHPAVFLRAEPADPLAPEASASASLIVVSLANAVATAVAARSSPAGVPLA